MLWFVSFNIRYTFVIISGDSMQPTFKDGDIVVADKKFSIIRDDVYFVLNPDDDTLSVKRLIGIPKDNISFVDGVMFRNEKYIDDFSAQDYENGDYRLDDDEYLFIGDNRTISMDGRYWSRLLKEEDIVARLKYRIYPFNRIGGV